MSKMYLLKCDLFLVDVKLASKWQQRFVRRCADLMSGVTKVLQSVGVNCCTIQPEFPTCTSSGHSSAAASVEDLNRPCHLTCSESCGEFMCCSSLEAQTLCQPAAQEAAQQPGTLIVVNSFTEGKWINISFVQMLLLLRWERQTICVGCSIEFYTKEFAQFPWALTATPRLH